MNVKPIIAVTMGDPCGIGPEVVAKALNNPNVTESCCPLVIGNLSMLKAALKNIGSSLDLTLTKTFSIPELNRGTIPILDLENLDPDTITPGRLSKTAGRASMYRRVCSGNGNLTDKQRSYPNGWI